MTEAPSANPATPPAGCPAHADTTKINQPLPATLLSNLWWPLVQLPDSPQTANDSKCPVAAASTSEEAAKYAQTPQADQTVPLETARQTSSIPRGGTVDNWVYPSEQQIYNAMRRKGWQGIPEEAIPSVLQIHNTTNERTWRRIQEWEDSKSLRLVYFHGRPRDLTPKAWVYSKLLGQTPFDRHDWYVAKETGKIQRYVIDYYEAGSENMPITYLDVRPALDHPRACALRLGQFVKEALPGFAGYYKKYKESQQGGE
jgi:cytochrome c heme-lyase